jgi:hypothetical protein
MRGVKASDHASGSAVIKPLQTKKKYRLEAERPARESSSRLLVEIAVCGNQNDTAPLQRLYGRTDT